MANYSPIEKLFHRLALNFNSIRAMSSDIDSLFASRIPDDFNKRRHVFITGLARSGTSILLQILYETKNFGTLTYRNMPFVLAPNLWNKISGGLRKKSQKSERAHGDGIMVGYDSPEAFEEVFWLTYTKTPYIHSDHLSPQKPDDIGEDEIERFRRLTASIVGLSENKGAQCYLSKNNNNLLRVPILRRIFPRCAIIIPFREPMEHAASLLNQHKRFISIHREDPYSLKYMNWLGHFEFGANHKPFLMSGSDRVSSHTDTSTIKYWVENWIRVYQFVLKETPPDCILLSYDRLITRPREVLKDLADCIDVDENTVSNLARSISPQKPHSHTLDLDQRTLNTARDIYEALISKAL